MDIQRQRGFEAMKAKLEYMYPGEILLNMSQKEVLDKLLASND